MEPWPSSRKKRAEQVIGLFRYVHYDLCHSADDTFHYAPVDLMLDGVRSILS
jgi:hypothetical protein